MMRSRSLRSSHPIRRILPLFLLAACATAAAVAADHEPPPAKDATSYPAVDVHAKEQVAIAAVPFDTPEQCKIFQVDYLKYDFLPIRIIVTNQGDRPISLNDARIYFVDAAGDRIQAAEPEDVERRLTPPNGRNTGIPVGPVHLHLKKKDSDNKIEGDFDHFEYAAIAVEPHTTRAGFLFYDMKGLGDNPLHGASLVLRELRNADGQELFFFQIPFDRYLAASKR
ncbi:MAG TPA: hypothetical protein VMD25_13050 [Acidobacteriaceae bacterium]|nr:hypothetical protein [Acidobacteriaceae bacterium]